MKIKRIICSIMTIVSLFVFASCGKTDKDSGSSQNNSGGSEIHDGGGDNVKVERRADNPSYENIAITNDYFFKNGKSDYKIIIPENFDKNEDTAVSEFNYFLDLAANITLPVIKDSQVVYDENEKYISIGQTSLLKQSGIKGDDKILHTSGYMIKSKGKNVYLFGRSNDRTTDYGVVYAVYGFLKEEINLKIYATDCYTYDELAKSKMRSFDVLDVPDFRWRDVDSARCDELYNLRVRQQSGSIKFLGDMHTHYIIMPYEKYGKEHPDWYTPDGGQLRMLNEEMRLQFVENCKEIIRNDPVSTKLVFGINDNCLTGLSDADAKEVKEKYNTTESGMNIVFLNKVIEDLEKWLAEEYPEGRNIEYMTLAYTMHNDAPATFDEKLNKYVPHSEYVIPHEKLNIHITFMPMNNWNKSLLDSTNASIYEMVRAWGDLTNNISIYSYGINYRNLQMNFLNLNSWESNLTILKDLGVNEYYEQFVSHSNSAAFEELRVYVQTQTLWNTCLHVDDLAKEFIDVYYGAAAPQVWEYWVLTNNNLAIQSAENGMSEGHTTGNPAGIGYYPFALVEKMAEVLDEGERAYDYLKTEDPELYEVMVNRIRQQKFTVQYLQMTHYHMYYSKSDIARILDEMEETAMKNNIVHIEESDEYNTPIIKINKWRNQYL